MKHFALSLAFASLPMMFGASVTQASDIELPSTMAWTAYGTNSSGYAQVVAIGNMLQSQHGTAVRILPGDNDVSRMTPLKNERVDLCACGIASYYGAEGVLMFADRDWGPQPIRLITTSTASFGLSIAVAGDMDVETPADLEGMRVAYIRGDDALNKGTEAYLAFGGLTWDDVERVDFPGYSRSFDGIIAGDADASFTTSVTPPAQQLASSPRGISWPRLDPDDSEGWARMAEVAPYFQPHLVTAGAGGVSPENPVESASYPYPIVIGNDTLEESVAYNLIKTMQEDFDVYKDSAPGADGYALENQDLTWVIPFHEGVIRYYEEIGVWNDELQEHQDHLVRRQNVILEAWDNFIDDAPSDDDEFTVAWMEARAEALGSEGMDLVFE